MSLGSLNQVKENTFNPMKQRKLNATVCTANSCFRQEREWCGLKK